MRFRFFSSSFWFCTAAQRGNYSFLLKCSFFFYSRFIRSLLGWFSRTKSNKTRKNNKHTKLQTHQIAQSIDQIIGTGIPCNRVECSSLSFISLLNNLNRLRRFAFINRFTSQYHGIIISSSITFKSRCYFWTKTFSFFPCALSFSFVMCSPLLLRCFSLATQYFSCYLLLLFYVLICTDRVLCSCLPTELCAHLCMCFFYLKSN